jgi:hypothetical protein
MLGELRINTNVQFLESLKKLKLLILATNANVTVEVVKITKEFS